MAENIPNLLEKHCYTSLINSETIYYVTINMEGKYTFVNNYFQKQFAPIAENFVGMPFKSTVYGNDYENCTIAAEKCILTPGSIEEVDIRKSDGKGGYFWSHWQFSCIRDENGNPLEIECIGYDTTTEQNAQLQLKSYANKLSAIIDSTTDVNFFISSRYKLISFNKKAYENALELHGTELNEGDNFLKFIASDMMDNFKSEFKRALNGESFQVDRQVKYSEDKQIWFRTLYFPVRNTSGSILGVALNVRNIDEKKKDDIKLREQNEQLKEIARLQSHEIRRPLASILGIIELIKGEGTSNDSEDLISMLKTSAEELDSVIHNIVDMTNSK